eukprot:GFYU01014428.1.p1 GENE.GFYU01014428.1~~GFYU01014428.1.p1  ORF type:complete len:716 (+),score=163.59 GFYU01014428.1:332-2479(+)
MTNPQVTPLPLDTALSVPTDATEALLSSARKPPSQNQLRSTAAFVLLMLAVSMSVAFSIHFAYPTPKETDAECDDFSEGRAREHIEYLTETIGVRYEKTDRELAVEYIRRKLESIQALDKDLVIEGVTNIAAKLPVSKQSSRLPYSGSSVVIAAHYDSVSSGPGATDDALGVGVALEVLRMLTVKKARGMELTHDLIVLFTDQEERGLVGSIDWLAHGKWSSSARVVVNLEGSGAAGKGVLLRCNRPWLLDVYGDNVKSPHANSMGQTIYNMMKVAYTDLDAFDAHGIAGVDILPIQDRYIYHSPQDTLDKIKEGAVQHIGDQVSQMVQGLIQLDDDLPTRRPAKTDIHDEFDVTNYEMDSGVYYSVLGSGFARMSKTTALTLFFTFPVCCMLLFVGVAIALQNKLTGAQSSSNADTNTSTSELRGGGGLPLLRERRGPSAHAHKHVNAVTVLRDRKLLAAYVISGAEIALVMLIQVPLAIVAAVLVHLIFVGQTAEYDENAGLQYTTLKVWREANGVRLFAYMLSTVPVMVWGHYWYELITRRLAKRGIYAGDLYSTAWRRYLSTELASWIGVFFFYFILLVIMAGALIDAAILPFWCLVGILFGALVRFCLEAFGLWRPYLWPLAYAVAMLMPLLFAMDFWVFVLVYGSYYFDDTDNYANVLLSIASSFAAICSLQILTPALYRMGHLRTVGWVTTATVLVYEVCVVIVRLSI